MLPHLPVSILNGNYRYVVNNVCTANNKTEFRTSLGIIHNCHKLSISPNVFTHLPHPVLPQRHLQFRSSLHLQLLITPTPISPPPVLPSPNLQFLLISQVPIFLISHQFYTSAHLQFYLVSHLLLIPSSHRQLYQSHLLFYLISPPPVLLPLPTSGVT